MITQQIQTFKLGVDKYPNWFYTLDKDRVKFNLNEDGSLRNVEFSLGKNIETAYLGDIIGFTGTGVIVIPQDAAKKYM